MGISSWDKPEDKIIGKKKIRRPGFGEFLPMTNGISKNYKRSKRKRVRDKRRLTSYV